MLLGGLEELRNLALCTPLGDELSLLPESSWFCYQKLNPAASRALHGYITLKHRLLDVFLYLKTLICFEILLQFIRYYD